MDIKFLVDEDIANYKKTSMFIGTAHCSFKCDLENGNRICQNSSLVQQATIQMEPHTILDRYISNPLTHAIVFGGLEPLDEFDGLMEVIELLRRYTSDDIVIYTGYNKDEITDKLEVLCGYSNIIMKYGRFKPNQEPHWDRVLGVQLASDNQYAEALNED